MRLTILFLLVSLFQLQANESYAQRTKISLTLENVTLEQVLDKIESLTEFKFIYKDKDVDYQKLTSITAKKEQVSTILNKLFEGSKIEYKVIDRQIILKLKKEPIKQNTRLDNLKADDVNPLPQGIEIAGTVVDANGQPLPGANVLEKGTTNGVQSDFDGKFSLTVSNENAILVISYVGFLTKEILVGNQTSIAVSLVENAAALDEVVVVGYGLQKKANLTGAVSSVNFDEVIADRPQTISSRALQGVIPGLDIDFNQGRPGTGTSISIRGIAGIDGSTGSPLILMDNVPVDIGDVNPNDIESISVLKDAASSAIYGGRAAFGVILITTKKGKRNTKPKFNYTTTMTMSKPTEVAKATTTGQFVRALTDFGTTSFWTGQDIPTWLGFVEQYEQDPSAFPLGYAEDNGLRYPLAVNDVLGEFIDNTGFTQIHNLSFSGGTENSNYRVSMGYSDEDGIMVTNRDSFTRYNLNGYIESDVSDKLTLSLNTLYRASSRLDPIGNYTQAISFYSFTPLGNFITDTGEEIPYDSPANIVRLRTPIEREEKTTRLTGKLVYKPFTDFTLTGEYTYENDLLDIRNTNNQPQTISSQRFTPNGVGTTSYSRSHRSFNRKALNIYASYAKSFGNHNFKLLAGFNNEEFSRESFSASGQDLIDPNLPFLDGTTSNFAVGDSFGEWATQGVFGRLNYNYADKYLFEANARYDGSSRFPRNDRFGVFPSFSAGWNISKESFFEPLKTVISNLKFRGSWGDIGNQDTGDNDSDFYPFLPGLPAVNAGWIDPNTGLRYTTLQRPGLVSPSFTWERARTLNIGMDAGFFNNRLSLTFEWFKRDVIDQLDEALPLPVVLGTAAPLQNVSDTQNLGWEVSVGWKDTIGEHFSYYVNTNVSDVYKSRVTGVLNDPRLIGTPYVGRNFGEIWGLVSDGFFTVDDFESGTLDANLENGVLKDGLSYFPGVNPNPGDAKYLDLDGDGEIRNGSKDLDDPQDRTIIGNSRRRYRFGASGGASYKGFDFSFRLVGVGKRDMNISNNVFWPYRNQFQNIFQNQLDYWTPDNTDAFYPRIYVEGQGNYPRSRNTQSRYLSNGAYLTVQNITFGYSFPSTILERTFIDKLRLYFTAENPIMIDHLPDGLHPEFQNLGGGGIYPFRRQYGLGLNMTF
ncbi:SusC/RagA family TonB-linked outer membrane protein [Aestuariivivens insulae]|uniref:SusC/RagA family TonB-linked outer membrane protein n=1 Tax=Aestuariivivens insulae TaxID=1621988 RepID=UPI001F5A45F5|nr:SusC/RagA family TonB-linked outer membrane protein [Aestuariivivens insulae]